MHHKEWKMGAMVERIQPIGQKRADMLCHPCILGDPQTMGDEIRIGCLTPAFSGARKRAEMLHHPCILGVPNKGDKIRSQNLC